jgi:hypothetical protein
MIIRFVLRFFMHQFAFRLLVPTFALVRIREKRDVKNKSELLKVLKANLREISILNSKYSETDECGATFMARVYSLAHNLQS